MTPFKKFDLFPLSSAGDLQLWDYFARRYWGCRYPAEVRVTDTKSREIVCNPVFGHRGLGAYQWHLVLMGSPPRAVYTVSHPYGLEDGCQEGWLLEIEYRDQTSRRKLHESWKEYRHVLDFCKRHLFGRIELVAFAQPDFHPGLRPRKTVDVAVSPR